MNTARAGGRVITKNMPALKRFMVGDTVAHFSLGDGVVTQNQNGIIQVTYQRRYPRDCASLAGKPVVQNYDAHWFELNPRRLFHRGDITALPEAKS